MNPNATPQVQDRTGHNNSYHRAKRMRKALTKEVLEREYLERQRSTTEIASQFSVSRQMVGSYLKEFSIPTRAQRRLYKEPINIEGFVNSPSDWHAYWLGFIAADGCVFSNSLTIKLKHTDIELLENLKTTLGLENPLRLRTDKQGYESATLCVFSVALVQALSAWGIVPNKTLTIAFPTFDSIDITAAFIRGYFDGDGTVYIRNRGTWTEGVCRFTSGSPLFLSGLEKALNSLNIATRPIYKSGNSNAHVLALSGNKDNLRRFAHVIYGNSTISLDRKRLRFNDL